MSSTFNTIRIATNIFTKNEKKKLLMASGFQVSLAILDLIGVGLIGVLGTLAVRGVQSNAPGHTISRILDIFGLQGYSFQGQVAIIGLVAASVLIARTLLSIVVSRKILYFLCGKAASFSELLVSKILAKNLLEIQRNASQETLYAVTGGVNSVIVGIVGSSILIIADVTLLLLLGFTLMLVNISAAVGSLLLFSMVAFLLNKLMHNRAQELGLQEAKLVIQSNQQILEVLGTYREAIIKDRRQYYIDKIGKSRKELASVIAEATFMPSISKYVIEIAIVVSALFLSASQFLILDAAHAIATLSIFMAAGTRIAPALLRIQQSTVNIRNSIGSSENTLKFFQQNTDRPISPRVSAGLSRQHLGFIPQIDLQNISLTYPNRNVPTLRDISLSIRPGEFVAFVGASGAGKSTLADATLGVIDINMGSISISGVSPLEASTIWPGAIGYVPQDVMIADGTIRENIALGFPVSSIPDEAFWEALRGADLETHVRNLSDGLDSRVGERGLLLSGGQRQRLGIARALLTNPKLLVLDEATSALDEATESRVSDSIQSLKGDTTLIVIAHRLTTIRAADRIYFLENGEVITSGSYQQVLPFISEHNHE